MVSVCQCVVGIEFLTIGDVSVDIKSRMTLDWVATRETYE